MRKIFRPRPISQLATENYLMESILNSSYIVLFLNEYWRGNVCSYSLKGMTLVIRNVDIPFWNIYYAETEEVNIYCCTILLPQVLWGEDWGFMVASYCLLDERETAPTRPPSKNSLWSIRQVFVRVALSQQLSFWFYISYLPNK